MNKHLSFGRSAVVLPAPISLPAQRSLTRVLARVLPWVLFAGILLVAIALRVYRLEGLVTYYPDSYAQLRSAENALSGDLPLAYLYPPGIGLLFAPFFAFLPDSLETMQAVIILASLALVVLAYAWGQLATRDRRAAFFFATVVAVGATFVFYSRATLFDVINTLFIALTLFLAPYVVRQRTTVLIGYALLVFLTITLRYANAPIVLPVLFVASLDVGERGLTVRSVLRHLRSRAVLTVGLVVATLYLAYLATAFQSISRFTNSDAGSIVDLTTYAERLGRYLEAMLIGYGDRFHWEDAVAAVPVLCLAALGARRLWQTNPSAAAPVFLLLALWVPLHAFYDVFAGRYAMPAFFFVLCLASFGLSISLRHWASLEKPWQRVGFAGLLALSVTFFVGRQLAFDMTFLQQWPADVAKSREVAYQDIRDALRELDGDRSVLLSSQALAVDKANSEMTTYDLIRHSETHGINQDSIALLMEYVRAEQAQGKTVYYHYTEFEDVGSTFRKYELGFDAYFSAVKNEFSLTEMARSLTPTRVQVLYALGAPPASE